jgi:hypothetical protein
MTLVGFAFPPVGVGCHVGRLYSWDNLRATQIAPRCMRSVRYKLYVMPKQYPACSVVLTVSTQSRLKAPHSGGAWLSCKMNAGLVCVH